MKTAKHIVTGLALAGVLLSAGCVKLWQKNLDIKSYMVEAERTAAPLDTPRAGKLWIDQVTVLSPYNIRNLVLRDSDVEYTVSYYSELIIPPADNFRNAFFLWFSASGHFDAASLTERGDMSHRMVVTVVDFYGDTTTTEAVLSIRVSLLDEKKKAMRVLFSKEYSRRVALQDVNAEELIRAYNAALTQILTDCEQDVTDALP